MAMHIITEAQAVIARNLGILVLSDGGQPAVSGNRNYFPILTEEQRIRDEAAEQERAHIRQADLNSGLAEWRKISGEWLIAGTNLVEGQRVTVKRRDKSMSTEIVGTVVGETTDGLMAARVGHLVTR